MENHLEIDTTPYTTTIVDDFIAYIDRCYASEDVDGFAFYFKCIALVICSIMFGISLMATGFMVERLRLVHIYLYHVSLVTTLWIRLPELAAIGFMIFVMPATLCSISWFVVVILVFNGLEWHWIFACMLNDSALFSARCKLIRNLNISPTHPILDRIMDKLPPRVWNRFTTIQDFEAYLDSRDEYRASLSRRTSPAN